MTSFFELLKGRFQKDACVCVGLDSDPTQLPKSLSGETEAGWLAFNQNIVEATAAYASAFKPQSAVYEASGEMGLRVLQRTIAYIKTNYPSIPVILDAKRADIGSTNLWYAKMAFEDLGCEAITLHPYLGGEALQPFLAQKEKGLIILCHTSNPSAAELQELKVSFSPDLLQGPAGHYGQALQGTSELPLYQYLALRVANYWNTNQNCALVMGATYPEPIAEMRALLPDMPFLIPGIGAQGGDLQAVVKAARSSEGEGMIISASRSIMYASTGPDFAEAAAAEAKRMNDLINQYRK